MAFLPKQTPVSQGLVLRIVTVGMLVMTACAPAAAPPPPKEAAPKAAPTAQPQVAAQPTAAAKPAAAQPAPAQPTAAAKPAAPQPATAPKVVRIAFGTEPESRDPYGHSTNTAYAIWLHVMEPLVEYDFDKKTVVGVLAESWENPDPQTWRFKLRRGVKFHDGSDFTSKDVVHSFNRIMTDPISKQGAQLSVVETVQAVDDYTVDLKTKTVFAPLLAHLMTRVITSKTAFDQSGPTSDQALVGTGPFKFKEFVQGERFVVTKNPSYWGKPPEVDEVVFRAIAEDQARVTSLLNGEVDVIANVPPEQVERITGNARVEGISSLSNIFLALNPIEEPLKKVEVRRAIYHAIDRKAIVDNVMKGEGYLLEGPISPDFYGYDPNLQPTYPYDPARAKELLAQAGYPNGFTIEQWTSAGRTTKDKETSEAIAGMLRQVGIQAELKTAEWSTYFGDLISNGKIPLYLINRGDQVDPNPYLHQYFRTGVSKRLQGFSDPKVDELLKKEAETVNSEQRLIALRQAQSAIMEAAPAVFLYTLKASYGVSNRVVWTPRADGYKFGQTMQMK